MQIALAVFFFSLLATSAVLADDADSEGWKFVQENGRTYYKKGDIKEKAWRVIDGKTYYFDHVSGEMVVGWQYIPFPSKGSTIGPYPNGLRLESMPMPQWYYFGQDGVLQEFVGKQVLEAKMLPIPTNIMGNNMIVQQRNESIILKTNVVIIL